MCGTYTVTKFTDFTVPTAILHKLAHLFVEHTGPPVCYKSVGSWLYTDHARGQQVARHIKDVGVQRIQLEEKNVPVI